MKALAQEVIRRIKYYNSTPVRIKQDDLFLVEYPKSGITWLSFILANIIQQISEPSIKINFFNFTQTIADINYSRFPSNNKNPFGYRIIKSHAKYNPYYNHVVLLIRNPFNVMLSYYNFLNKLNQTNDDFKGFIKNEKFGIKAWVKHTESWLKTNQGGHRFSLIRYEDLINDTQKATTSLLDTFGWIVDEPIIRKAIELSSLEGMKAAELDYANKNPKYQLNFVRKDRKPVRQLELDAFNFIEKKSNHLLKELWSDINFKDIFLNKED